MHKPTQRIFKQLALCFAFGAAILYGRPAAADVLYPPSGAATDYIFVATAYGYPFAVYTDSSRTNCQFQLLGDHNGLDRDWDVLGDGGNNYMYFVNSSTNTPNCGLNTTWTPIQFNGHFLGLSGEYGDDFIGGSAFDGLTTSTYGGEGNDTFVMVYDSWSPGDGTVAFGNGGNDTFYIYGHSTWAHGHSGNDTFCVASWTTAEHVNGQTGSNTLCGSASTALNVTSSCPSACSSFPF